MSGGYQKKPPKNTMRHSLRDKTLHLPSLHANWCKTNTTSLRHPLSRKHLPYRHESTWEDRYTPSNKP